jgi:hypothetical protein
VAGLEPAPFVGTPPLAGPAPAPPGLRPPGLPAPAGIAPLLIPQPGALAAAATNAPPAPARSSQAIAASVAAPPAVAAAAPAPGGRAAAPAVSNLPERTERTAPVVPRAASADQVAGAVATSTVAPAASRQGLGVPVLVPNTHHDASRPLRELAAAAGATAPGVAIEEPLGRLPEGLETTSAAPRAPGPDPVLQPDVPGARAPAPMLNFAGLSNADNSAQLGTTVAPPDTNGDVGPNHYVQMVNRIYAVYNKSGVRILGPLPATSLWQGFGAPCDQPGSHDVVVIYDPLADRWLLTRFARTSDTGPFYQCIAISQTPDPTGAFYRYSFQFSKFNDFPKFGVWPNAYYITQNQFTDAAATTFAGVGVIALDRASMLAGTSANMVYIDLCPTNTGCSVHFSMLPSDLDGATPPAAGTPNYFAEIGRTAAGALLNQINVYEFQPNFVTPGNSTFTGPTVVPIAAFDADLCAAAREVCIPQPGTATMLEAISGRLMYRLQYRNFGTHQSLVSNLTVDADGAGRAGVRFAELRKVGAAAWSLFQEGTYSPDATHRWMGSAAMDRVGNIMVGYSVSSSTVSPGIRYTGRLVSDPLNTLPQGETTLIAGGGSQTGSARWGDYSMMAVDPVDDCTFWYTQQYYVTTSSIGWSTRIGSFRFPNCQPPPVPVCVPRPPVGVAVAPVSPGRLQVTLTAAAAANVRLLSLAFGEATNATIDIPDVQNNVPANYNLTLPPGTLQTTFYVNRVANGAATTARLTVNDSCSPWPTFVGGGATAF